MDWSTLITSIALGTLINSIIVYFLNKKSIKYRQATEIRREKYSEINELLKGLYDNAVLEEREKMNRELLALYRSLQVWSSDKVLLKFIAFLKAIDNANNLSQGDRNKAYLEFLIAMRKDLLGKTKIKPDDIFILGKIN